MLRRTLYLIVFLAVFIVPLIVWAQVTVAPPPVPGVPVPIELPAFLEAFAVGHWWVVPAFGLMCVSIGYADTFLKESGAKASWNPMVRQVWNFLAQNVLQSKNAPPPEDERT